MPDHPLKTMMSLDHQLTDRLAADQEFAFADGALPRKIKLLMGMAFDAAQGAVGGVQSLASQAMKAGATKEEIAEALRVAYLFNGVGSVYIASQALEDLFP
ncbi:MAG: carboxymuconolactone decarboxylase family protein [Rectinemataceae bacterium]